MTWNPTNSVKGAFKLRVRWVAQLALLTPTTFKYVPAQSALDPLRITDIEEHLGLTRTACRFLHRLCGSDMVPRSNAIWPAPR